MTRISARVSIPHWPRGIAHFTIPWPPRPTQPRLLARVARAMRALPLVRLTEQVTSGPGATARSGTYRASGKSFMASEPFAAGAVDVRPLDRRPPYRRLAFVLPGSDIYYRIEIDRRYRLRRETIVSPGHLVRRTFRCRSGRE
jgi:hypothetical protein